MKLLIIFKIKCLALFFLLICSLTSLSQDTSKVILFDRSGKLIFKSKNDTIWYYNSVDCNKKAICVNCSESPIYPGGLDSLRSFIKNNFSYPVGTIYEGFASTYTFGFIVEKDGSISNLRILQGIPTNNPASVAYDKEISEVFMIIPSKFEPAVFEGSNTPAWVGPFKVVFKP